MFRYFEWLIPALPALGALLNSLPGTRITRRARTWIAGGALLGSLLAVVPILIGQILQPGLVGAPAPLPWIEIWTGSRFLSLSWTMVVDPVATLLVLSVLASEGAALIEVSDPHLDPLHHRRALILIDGTGAALLVLVLAGNLVSLFVGWSLAGWGLYALTCAGRRVGEHAEPTRGPHLAQLLLGDVSLWLVVGAVVGAAGPALPTATPDTSGAAAAGTLLLIAALARSTQCALQAQAPDRRQMAPPVLSVISALYLLARLEPWLAQTLLLTPLMIAAGLGSALLMAAAALRRPQHPRSPLRLALAQGGLLLSGVGVGAGTAALAFLPAYALIHLSISLSGSAPRPRSAWLRRIGLAALAGLPLLPGLAWHARLFQTAGEVHWAVLVLFVVAVLFLAAAAGRAARHPPAQRAPAGPLPHLAAAAMSAALLFLGLADMLFPPPLNRFLAPAQESSAFRSAWPWVLLSALTAGAGAAVGYVADRPLHRALPSGYPRPFDPSAAGAWRPRPRIAAWLAGSIEPWLGRWTFGLLARLLSTREESVGPGEPAAREQEGLQ